MRWRHLGDKPEPEPPCCVWCAAEPEDTMSHCSDCGDEFCPKCLTLIDGEYFCAPCAKEVVG